MLGLHIYPSAFTNETRILKIVRSLVRGCLFKEIRIFAIWKEGLAYREQVGPGIEVYRIPPLFGGSLTGGLGKVLKAVGWYLAVLGELRRVPIGCVNSHSLAVLPLSVLIKFWKKCLLVYEPHELETHTVGRLGFRQKMAFALERLFIPCADAVCLVNHSIAEWYSRRYCLGQTWVVRNIPYENQSPGSRTGLLRSAIGLSPEARLFIYQGLLAPGRGVHVLIDVFSKLSVDQNLVFMGYGPLRSTIEDAVARFPNIFYLPAVPPDMVQAYTCDADVGISLIENVCLSYYMSLPNKVFEYVTCGLPIIVSDFPEMARFVDNFNCGWKTQPDPNALSQLVRSIDAQTIKSLEAGARIAARNHSWRSEEESLFSMYASLGFQFDARAASNLH